MFLRFICNEFREGHMIVTIAFNGFLNFCLLSTYEYLLRCVPYILSHVCCQAPK